MTDIAFFYAFAALTVLGAILTVTLRSAIHCAISLIASLAGIAGLYLLQKAEFLFVIMLVNLDSAAKERQYHRHWIAAVVCLVGTGAVFATFLHRGIGSLKLESPLPPVPGAGNVETLSMVLFREYLVPFELASLLLLVAVVGGVMMAKKRID